MNEYEKKAIVGINGAGKSTLLKILAGEMAPDAGDVVLKKGTSLGYLSQHPVMHVHRTVFEEVMQGKSGLLAMEEQIKELEARMAQVPPEEMEAFLASYHRLCDDFERQSGYSIRSEIYGVLKGLGFAEKDFSAYCDELSGGQKTRVALAKLLVSSPDLILLDEPTNHLDIASIEWLENFLLNYKGTVLIVAHDRYFLDRVVSGVIEICRHTAQVYPGNYSEYAVQAEKVREEKWRAYQNQQREIARQEQVIEKLKSFNREKSVKRAESRQKQLDKLERQEKPVDEDSQMRLTLRPRIRSGKDVLTVFDLAKAYGTKQLFSGLNFEIKRGERVALIGQNGTGKTTILKILNELVAPDAGGFCLGTGVQIGYYDQEQQRLHDEKTLFEEMSDEYPMLNQTKIRNVLAAFLFTEDDVLKRVADLSGGERGRLSLAKLMLSDANFLILDEPTNHLDIESKEILENALIHYEGTVLFVSHDRYFINRTCTRILDLTSRQLVSYIGDYDYYIEKKENNEAAAGIPGSEIAAEHTEAAANPASLTNDWEKQKEKRAFERKRQQRLLTVEKEIEDAEERLKEIDQLYGRPEVSTNSCRLNELAQEQQALKNRLEELYPEWEELSE